MKVLIACSFSGEEREAFARLGHDSWSCDLRETEIPGQHIVGDALEVIASTRWDLIILHPPCTAMALSGNRWYGRGMPMHFKRLQAISWTLHLWEVAVEHADRVMLENPTSVIFPVLKARGVEVQYIQPWMFGHTEKKKTGYALHNLPRLKETNNVREAMAGLPRSVTDRIHLMPPGPNREKERSRAYVGIVQAVAQQWGKEHHAN